MPHPRRLLVFALLVAVVCLAGAPAARQEDGRLSDAAFAALVPSLSEKGGTFLSENFVSNERRYLESLDDLKARTRSGRPGGVYIGVGPDQNFSYILALQPSLAFVIDIRRQNLVEHLFYKMAFEASATRADFLSYIFSRQRPATLAADADLTTQLKAYLTVPYAVSLMKSRSNDALAKLHARFAPMLEKDDDGTLRHIFEAFGNGGPLLTYQGEVPVGRSGLGRYWPTIGTMMTATDAEGRQRSYMATERNFLAMKAMEERNLIVPVVGNFGGPKAVRAVGAYIRGRHQTVTAFYLSNVEQYLFQGGPWKQFYDNAATLPLDDGSTFIRLWAKIPQTDTPISLVSMKMFLDAYAAGKIKNYDDVGKFGR